MDHSKESVVLTNQISRSVKILVILFLFIIIFFTLPLIDLWIPAPRSALPPEAASLISSYLDANQNDKSIESQLVFSSDFVSHLVVNDLPPQISDYWDFSSWSVSKVRFHLLHPKTLWNVSISLQFDQGLTVPIQMIVEQQDDGAWRITEMR